LSLLFFLSVLISVLLLSSLFWLLFFFDFFPFRKLSCFFVTPHPPVFVPGVLILFRLCLFCFPALVNPFFSLFAGIFPFFCSFTAVCLFSLFPFHVRCSFDFFTLVENPFFMPIRLCSAVSYAVLRPKSLSAHALLFPLTLLSFCHLFFSPCHSLVPFFHAALSAPMSVSRAGALGRFSVFGVKFPSCTSFLSSRLLFMSSLYGHLFGPPPRHRVK